MFGVGPSELIIILVLALIIFGPGKLPEVGKAIGRSIKEFKAASSPVEEAVKQVTAPSPAPAQAQTQAQAAAQPAAAAQQGGAPAQETVAAAETADQSARS